MTGDGARADEPQDIHRLLERSHGAGLTYRRFDEPAATAQPAHARAAAPAGSAAALFPLLAEALPEFASIEAGSGGLPDAPAPPPPAPVAGPAFSSPASPLPPGPSSAPPPNLPSAPAPAFAPAPQAPPSPQARHVPQAAGGSTPLGSVFRLLGARPSTPHNPFGRR